MAGMMKKSLLAGMCALFPLTMAETPAADLAPQSAEGKTFTFSQAKEEQCIARATAQGDIPRPVHASTHTPRPVTVTSKAPPPAACTYTKTGPATARLSCGMGTSVWLTFETPDSGTCTVSESMPGATRTYSGIRFTMR